MDTFTWWKFVRRTGEGVICLLIAAMILSGFLGTVYGSALLERMPEETFRRWFRVGITVMALDLLRRGFLAL